MRACRKIGARLCAVCAADPRRAGRTCCRRRADTDDAARLASLGAKNVSVTGNLKFDIEPRPRCWNLAGNCRTVRHGAQGVSAPALATGGSTAARSAATGAYPGLLLVIVPRHPQRFAGGCRSAGAARHPVPAQERNGLGKQAAKPCDSAETQAVLATAWGDVRLLRRRRSRLHRRSLLPYAGRT